MIGLRHFAAATVIGTALCISGCAREAPPIPANAMLVSEGDGRLAYTTPNDGTAYVYDETSGTLIWSGQVSKGQAILLEPDHHRISVDGRVVQEEGMTRGNHHRIFVAKNMTYDSKTTVEETHVEKTNNNNP